MSVFVIFGAILADAQLEPLDDFLPPLESNSTSSPGLNGYDSSLSSSNYHQGPIGNEVVIDAFKTVWRARKDFNGPKCPIDFEGKPPDCRAIRYLLVNETVEICPDGTYGVFPDCRKPCGRYMIIALNNYAYNF